MSDFIIPEKNKRNFQDIVFAHLERILEICKQEFTGGYYNTVVSGNVTKSEYIGDKKEEYCQLIEALADILIPRFDDEMNKQYKEYETKLESAMQKYHDENGIPLSNDHYNIYSRIRLKLTRKLFRDLNLLLGRKNYLKAELYTYKDLQDEEEESIADIDEDRT